MSNQILNWAKVREIRIQSAKGVSKPKLAAKYGVSRPQISKIVNRKCWADETAAAK